MIEAALALWFLAVGLTLLWPLSGTATFATRLALAIPAGVSAYLLVSWVQVSLGVTYSPGTPLAIVTVVSLVALFEARDRIEFPTPFQLGAVAGVAVTVALLSWLFQSVALTRVSPDSIRYLTMAGVLAQEGGLDAVHPYDVVQRQAVEGLLFSLSAYTDRVYLASITPIFGLSGFAAMVALTDEGLAHLRVPQPFRKALPAAGLVLVLSSNRAVDNLFYVHGHMLTAVFLFVGVAATWLARLTRRWTWIALATPALVLLVGVRVEGFLIAVLVLTPVLADPAVPPRPRWSLAGGVAGAIGLWFGGVVRPMLAGGGPSHADAALLVGVGIVVATHLSQQPRLRALFGQAPRLLILSLLVALVVFTVLDPGTMVASVVATAWNLIGIGGWRLTWLGLLPAIGLAVVYGRVPHARMWWVPLVGFLLLMFVLVYLRGGAYRVGFGDSGNRMLMHVFFIAIAYVALTVGERLRRGTHAAALAPGRR